MRLYQPVLLLVLICLESVTPSRILVLYSVASQSQKNFANPIIKALSERGHDIVVVSPYKTPVKSPHVRDIILNNTMEHLMAATNGTGVFNMFDIRANQYIKIPMIPHLMLAGMLNVAGKNTLESQEYQQLGNEKFDIILMCAFMNDLNLGLVHKLGIPVIQLMAGPYMTWHAALMGNPASHVPNSFFDFNDDMDFIDRTLNFVSYIFTNSIRTYYYMPRIHALVAKYYPDVPPLMEIEKNATSMILTNSHFSINYARPHLPTIVEVGCVHCRPTDPLPKEFLDFIEGSGEHGVVYFSFGSVIQAHMMPENICKSFLEAFAKIPQRVLWKWETETMEGLPPNVKLSKWMPQQDILGHPKVKVFITHGGMLSMQESTYHGVPLIGIPFFGDQDLNMRRAENAGQGIKLELGLINKDIIIEAINKITTDKRYQENVNSLSVLLSDQETVPIDRAVYWVEYVIRHNGAHHLRAVAANMPWYQYHLTDVIVFLGVVIGTAVLLFVLFLTLLYKCIIRFLFKKKESISKTKKRQ